MIRLKEVVYCENNLSLIFEYCDYDLQIFVNKFKRIGTTIVKVISN